jgi:hypothetical protein
MTRTPNEPDDQLKLKQCFLDRARNLSNVLEVHRCLQVTLLIAETVAFGVRAEAEIFEAAYGDPSGRKYWEAHLSEPISVYSLAHVLSAHLAEKAEQLELVRIAIIRAFRDAVEAGERWFIGDTSPLLALEQGQTSFENLGKVKVKPRAAAEWLLSKPKRSHLVPGSLRMVLERGTSPWVPPGLGPLLKNWLSAWLPITSNANERRGRIRQSSVLRLLQGKQTSMAVEIISGQPCVEIRPLR